MDELAVYNRALSRCEVLEHSRAYAGTPAPAPDFEEVAKLTASDSAPGDIFGWSVAIDCDTAVIGALIDQGDDDDDAGSVYVFTRSAGVWSEQDKLTASDVAAADGFGGSVAIDGDTAVIGATFDDDNGDSSGSAYVFAPNPVIVAIENLIRTVVRSNLQQGIENALAGKLDAVAQALDGTNENNHVAAFNILNAFIQNVEAQRGSQLTNAAADQLVAGAQAIIDLLTS